MSNTDTKKKASKKSNFDWRKFDENKFFSETDRVAKFFKPATDNK